MLSLEEYRKFLLNLLPRGLAWPRETTAFIFKCIEGISIEFHRVQIRADILREEKDPRTTTELLEEWEAVVGIPDGCAPPAPTLERRRADVLARLTQAGAINIQFYIDFAASLGFDITITEYRPFVAGSSAGDPLTNGDWIFVFLVTGPIETINYFSAGISQAGDPLANWGNQFLECAINKRKPAHTLALYAYVA
jgi:uncharacterized protein YmfQ (DUF2313 family)